MKYQTNLKYFWGAAILIFLLDQGTKLWAINFLPLEDEYIINQFLSFQRIFNEATFLLDTRLPIFSITEFRIIYVMIALTLTAGLYWVATKPALQATNIETEFAKTGLFFMMGSIWGNTFDRLFRSEGVIDFIRINYFVEAIPILNIADITLHIANLCFLITWCIIIYKLIVTKFSLRYLK